MTYHNPPLPAGGKSFLINRNFAWLASGQAISNLGDFVYSTTLFIWVFTITHSVAAVSGVLAAQYIPVFLLGPLAGVFVDRWDRRQTMLISFQSWYIAGLIICFLMSIPQGGIPVAFGPLLMGATPKEMMGRVQAVVDTSMSGVSLISVALAASLGQFLPVGVILTGCGILIALAGLFGWFAIQEKASVQPEVRPQFSDSGQEAQPPVMPAIPL